MENEHPIHDDLIDDLDTLDWDDDAIAFARRARAKLGMAAASLGA